MAESICMLALTVLVSPAALVQVVLMTIPKLIMRPGITKRPRSSASSASFISMGLNAEDA